MRCTQTERTVVKPVIPGVRGYRWKLRKNLVELCYTHCWSTIRLTRFITQVNSALRGYLSELQLLYPKVEGAILQQVISLDTMNEE